MMGGAQLLREARTRADMTSAELADAADTVRTAVSAYENGRKSPTVDTFERLLHAAGFSLAVEPNIRFETRYTRAGRPFDVPDLLPRLEASAALRRVRLPLHLLWSGQARDFHLADRTQRALVYQAVLTEGTADDILDFVDGALLVDLWGEMLLPPEIETAWRPLIERARDAA